jgi:hypothetical protein
VEQYPAADTIHLVIDNLNIHCRKSLTDCFGEQKGRGISNRLSVHYTPKHGSWLDQAEIELSMFSRQCLGTRRIPDLATLKRETKAWNRKANRKRTKPRSTAIHATKGQKAVQRRATRPQYLKTGSAEKPPARCFNPPYNLARCLSRRTPSGMLAPGEWPLMHLLEYR